MDELSLRHIPDLSDASSIADFSDSSFQIPAAARNADDLLLADNTMGFFDNVNDTFANPATPAPPTRSLVQPPLTLAELTPRSRFPRAVPVRSSLRPRPGVATPYKAIVAQELSTALSEDLSPLRNQDPSFQIPPPQTNDDDLLTADDGNNFLCEEPSIDASSTHPRSSLTCSPGPVTRPSSSVTPNDSPLDGVHDHDEPITSTQTITTESAQEYREASADSSAADRPSAPSAVDIPNVSESIPEVGDAGHRDLISKKGKGKALSTTNPTERQKKHHGGDKAKRKQVAPSAAVSNPAKLKPLTASLARKLSNSGKKSAPAVRRRPLQGVPSSTTIVGSRIPAAGTSDLSDSFAPSNDVKPFRSGGLADTLMSFGQKLIADAQKSEEHREVDDKLEAESLAVFEAEASARGTVPLQRSTLHSVGGQLAQIAADRDYLTLSQLSPRKLEDAVPPSATMDPPNTQLAPLPALDQPCAPVSTPSEHPPSPMRRSIKRAASPTIGEFPAHQRKRSKTVTNPSAPSSSKELRSRKPVLQASRAKNVPAASISSSRPSLHTRRVASVTISGADRAKKTRPGDVHSRSLSKSALSGGDKITTQPSEGVVSQNDGDGVSSNSGSRSGTSVSAQKESVPNGEEHLTDGQTSSRLTSVGDRPPTNLPPARPTRPEEFTFATSTRIGTRSNNAELGRSSAATMNAQSLKRSRAAPAIPDFKALHAAQESVFAQKRAEGLHPTVPIEFALATDSRAHDREKFDAARRERERELERQAEERRRQRELEEEAEVRELRRRAVPKANEVPGWYAHAPKKTKADAGGR